MPTVLRIGGLRVVIYPNDHRPAHVHVIGDGEAGFILHCPNGPPKLRESYGVSKLDVSRIEAELAEHLAICASNGARSMAITDDTFAEAEQRAQARRQAGYAVAARYDRRTSRVVVTLNTDVQISFPARLAEGLANASPETLAVIEVTPSGLGLHWPKLDADLYVPSLLAGQLGSKRWMAAQLGAAGGRARSPAKAASSRENGRKGGRPRKAVAQG